MKPWILYSLLRLGIFAAAFSLLMVAQVEWWLSAIVAAILGFAISYIFFGKLRDAVALDIVARRAGPSHDPDREAEDAESEARNPYNTPNSVDSSDVDAEPRDLESDR